MTHDHELLTDARSPETQTEAVDVSAEWTPGEDQDRERHLEAPPMNEDETRSQQLAQRIILREKASGQDLLAMHYVSILPLDLQW